MLSYTYTEENIGMKTTRKTFQKDVLLKKFYFILKDHAKERPSFNLFKDFQRSNFTTSFFWYPFFWVIFQVWLPMLELNELQ